MGFITSVNESGESNPNGDGDSPLTRAVEIAPLFFKFAGLKEDRKLLALAATQAGNMGADQSAKAPLVNTLSALVNQADRDKKILIGDMVIKALLWWSEMEAEGEQMDPLVLIAIVGFAIYMIMNEKTA